MAKVTVQIKTPWAVVEYEVQVEEYMEGSAYYAYLPKGGAKYHVTGSSVPNALNKLTRLLGGA